MPHYGLRSDISPVREVPDRCQLGSLRARLFTQERGAAAADRLALGLHAEAYDPETGRHLGNFPQAFSPLALIEAAARMIVLEGLAEL